VGTGDKGEGVAGVTFWLGVSRNTFGTVLDYGKYHRMPSTATLTEMDIFSDVIASDVGDMPVSVAQSILRWKFSKQALSRMNQLARKNRTSRLSATDKIELDNFMRVGTFIDLIQAKARLSLKSC
jgi:hypothetical protein